MKVSYCIWNNGESVDHSCLPVNLKRRLTPLGRDVNALLYNSLEANKHENIRWVASSRHGDHTRVIRLLTGLNEQTVLPVDFSFSVHNAIIGVFSIASKNQLMYTALAAGQNSFVAGLIEAIALQQEYQASVGYIYYDAPFIPGYEKLASEQGSYMLLLLENNNDLAKNSNISLEYKTLDHSQKMQDLQAFAACINFFKNNEKVCQIYVPGGQLFFQRNE
jgi:hypothetical protein